MRVLAFIVGFLFITSAFAQGVDPRLAQEAFAFIQARAIFLEAAIKVKDEDAKRLAEWWVDYVKGLK